MLPVKNYIKKQTGSKLEFDTLRNEGLELIQEYSGNTWTDHNLHDPGITILEQLCFAITDAGYRANFDIDKLLADANNFVDFKENSFFDASIILSSNAVTTNDYRKVIVDTFNEVENAWIETDIDPKTKQCGQHHVTIKIKEWKKDDVDEQKLTQKILDDLNQRRNTCEYFNKATILKPKKIRVTAELTVNDPNSAEKVLANVFIRIREYLYPPINFTDTNEALLKGESKQEVFSGPLLKHGIIHDDTLTMPRHSLEKAELVKAILPAEHVTLVKIKDVELVDSPGQEIISCSTGEYLDIDNASILNDVKIIYNDKPIEINERLFHHYLHKYDSEKEQLKARHYTPHKGEKVAGNISMIDLYYSIQNYFPVIYGISNEGLEKSASTKRRAEAKQLKAYIMLFEQLLANHVAQLANLSNLFSNKVGKNGHTIYSQPLYTVPGAQDIIKAFTERINGGTLDIEKQWEIFKSQKDNAHEKALSGKVESRAEYYRRKNAILDHLLARHNEILPQFAVESFVNTYAPEGNLAYSLLEYKSHYYSQIGHFRSNYSTETEDVIGGHAGLMLKIALLLNIQRRTPSATFLKADYMSDSNTGKRMLTGNLIIKRNSQISVDDTSGTSTNSLTFSGQGKSFFLEALTEENYMVSFYDDEYRLNYKPTNKRLGSHDSKEKALVQKEKIMDTIRAFNINSEGFHVVEHMFLAPGAELRAFGFRYRDLIMKRLTYDEREQELARLKLSDTSANVELFVHLDGNKVVWENFFKLQITVVLPDWPARFQDKNFKSFLMNTFKSNLPAHVWANFKWMNMSQMSRFEKHYLKLSKNRITDPNEGVDAYMIEMLAPSDLTML